MKGSLIRHLFRIFVLFLLSSQAISSSGSNINNTNKVLKNARLYLQNKNQSSLILNKHLELLLSEIKKAKQCMSKQESKLSKLEQELIPSQTIINKKNSSDSSYFKSQSTKILKQYVKCRLFYYKGNDIAENLKQKISLQSKHVLWLRHTAIWDWHYNKLLTKKIILKNKPDVELTFKFILVSALTLIFLVGVIILSIYSIRFKKLLNLFNLKCGSFKQMALELLIYIALVILSISLNAYFIFPGVYLAIFLFLAVPISLLFLKSIFINLNKSGYLANNSLVVKYFIYISRIVAVLILIAFIIGYYNIAVFVSISALITSAYLFGAILLVHLISQTFHLIIYHQQINARIRSYFLVDSFSKIHEFKLIKILLIGAALFYCLLGIVDIWDISHLADLDLLNLYFKGGTFFNIKLIPGDYVNAIAIYCFLGLLIRFVLRNLQSNKSTKENSMQNINPIIMNIGFIGAALIALLAAGVNLTGLAIIAGALSVGIGISLKSIISNFISGIILIIEKPIKIGDRILVNGAEGIVSRIRIRSTEIKTRDRSDVLIPNEEIITNKVTNFMLREPYWRIHCPVGVAYGSDVDFIKKLLLQVAAENHEVVNNEQNHAPNALFKSFGDSSLEFELRCIVKNVNRKNFIISDLNTAIEKIFREHNIEIPFPQRDVHIIDNSL